MGEKLNEVIARMKANSQTSKTPIPTPKPVPVEEIPQEIEEDEEEYEEDEEIPAPKPQIKSQKPVPEQKVSDAEVQENVQRVMLLQDNGIFRAELLHQLSEINRALVVIAGTLVELTKDGNK